MSSPSLVPDQPAPQIVHMVLDDFGRLGRAWREMDEERTREFDIVDQILTNELKRPVRVVAFDVEEGWARDVTENIARAVIAESRRRGSRLHGAALDFVERVTGEIMPEGMIDA